MIDRSMSGQVYNRLTHLSGIEDRIIYYLLNPNNKTPEELRQVHTIWKILYYNDEDALNRDLPKYSQIMNLVSDSNQTQNKFRIFRSPRLEDSWVEECSLLKIYVDQILPTNPIISLVNIGIDIVVNTKIINLKAPKDNPDYYIDTIEGIPVSVTTLSRVTVLTQAVISLLNGAEIQGVGKLVFDREQSVKNRAEYGLWNNKNFEGIKVVMGTYISGSN